MPEDKEVKRRLTDDELDCFPPPYYPDEDRQLAAELMDLAGKLMDIAGRVIKPDHYWAAKPTPPYYDPPIVPTAKDKK